MAFLAATAHEGVLHIDEIDVLQSAQGRGLGRRLMAHALDWARSKSLAQATLTTFRNVPWNAPFYRLLGFAEVPEPGPVLRRIRERERDLGLDAHGRRIVMSAPTRR